MNCWFLKADKLLHCFVAALIVAIVYILSLAWGSPGTGFWMGNLLALIALIGKEVYDYYHPDTHVAELYDILAGLIGMAGIDLVILMHLITL